MSIFILEDDVIQAQQMKRLVEEICEKYMLPFDFIEVTSKVKILLLIFRRRSMFQSIFRYRD